MVRSCWLLEVELIGLGCGAGYRDEGTEQLGWYLAYTGILLLIVS